MYNTLTDREIGVGYGPAGGANRRLFVFMITRDEHYCSSEGNLGDETKNGVVLFFFNTEHD